MTHVDASGGTVGGGPAIGYVVKMFPRFSETFILAEMLELERRGQTIRVISLRKPDDGRFHEELARLRAPVSYVPEHVRCQPLRVLASHARAALRSPRAYLRVLAAAMLHLPASWAGFLRAPLVAEEAERAGCRWLHAHFASLPAVAAMFSSELSGIPFSFTAHAKDIYHFNRSRRLLRRLMFQARKVVTVSEFNLRHLSRLAGPALPPGRIVHVYNGLDLDLFRPSSGAVGGNDESDPLVLAVGRLVEKKGFETLVEACALLREMCVRFRCEIVGKGPLERPLAARIEELGLSRSVLLAGALPRGTVARRMRSAAVLAAPCVVGKDGNRDGLPTTILEAMAAGVPVIATPVTGIPEAVADGVTGLLVPPEDPQRLAAALSGLLGDPERRAGMGREGRRRAEELFDLRRNVARLERELGSGSEGIVPAGEGSVM